MVLNVTVELDTVDRADDVIEMLSVHPFAQGLTATRGDRIDPRDGAAYSVVLTGPLDKLVQLVADVWGGDGLEDALSLITEGGREALPS